MTSHQACRAISLSVLALLCSIGCSAADVGEQEAVGKDEQPVLMPGDPPEEPGSSCPTACVHFDSMGAIANTCCVCNGHAGIFRTRPNVPNLYFCVQP